MQTLIEAVLYGLHGRDGCQFTGCCADLPTAVVSLRYFYSSSCRISVVTLSPLEPMLCMLWHSAATSECGCFACQELLPL